MRFNYWDGNTLSKKRLLDMPRFLIDVNLPYYFSLWNTEEYIHQMDVAPRAKDKDIWQHAIEHDLIIITKDSDFSTRMLLSAPPPRVIHICLGNMNMKAFHQAISNCWTEAIQMVEHYKLVTVYKDHLEAIN